MSVKGGKISFKLPDPPVAVDAGVSTPVKEETAAEGELASLEEDLTASFSGLRLNANNNQKRRS